MSESDLRNRVIDAMRHTDDSLAYFEMFRYFAAPTTRKIYRSLFERYAPFFVGITTSSVFAMILSLYKRLEEGLSTPGEEPVDLRRILALAGRHGIVDREIQRQMKYKLRSVSDIWKRVARFRHRLVAHGLAGLSVQDEISSAGLDSAQCRRLACAYAEILNRIAGEVGLAKIDITSRRAVMASSIEDLLETLDKVVT